MCELSMEEKLEILNKFNNGKVTITVNAGGISVAYTYMNFSWDTDADMLVMGDEDTIHHDFSSIDIDEIIDVTMMNNDLIELELEDGNVTIILDTDYSLCFHCKSKRPVFYIRAIGETNEEYDIRICQDCFDKMISLKS
jgi:hypothetical protein